MRSVLKRELLGNIDKVWCQRVPQNKQIIHYWYSVMLNHDWPSFWLVLLYILSLSHYRYFWCKGKYYIEIHSKLARQCRRYICKYAAAKVAVTYTSAGHFDHKPREGFSWRRNMIVEYHKERGKSRNSSIVLPMQ